MSLLDQLRETFRSYFGIDVESRTPPTPDIPAVESAVAVSRIFHADCDRQKLDHDIAMRGIGPRVRLDNNSAELGRDR
jgi:hypothetical protein